MAGVSFGGVSNYANVSDPTKVAGVYAGPGVSGTGVFVGAGTSPVVGLSVLDSGGTAYAVPLTVLDSSNNPYIVTNVVLASDGTPYTVI